MMIFDYHANIEPAPPIRLRPVLDELEPDLDDWTLLDGSEPFMFHLPSHCIFRIGYEEAEPFTVFSLHALLVNRSGPFPGDGDIQKFGREGILAFWMILIGRDDVGMDLSGEVVFPQDEGVSNAF